MIEPTMEIRNYLLGLTIIILWPDISCFQNSVDSDQDLPNLPVNGPRREKTCLWKFANNTGAEQLAHPRSLMSAFVIRVLESTIY